MGHHDQSSDPSLAASAGSGQASGGMIQYTDVMVTGPSCSKEAASFQGFVRGNEIETDSLPRRQLHGTVSPAQSDSPSARGLDPAESWNHKEAVQCPGDTVDTSIV